MSWLQVIFLALLQGLTEFLPISSSGHLVLLPKFVGWPDQGLPFDVAVHFGSLIAVLWYFRVELTRIAVDLLAIPQRGVSADARLGLLVIVATVPVALAGLALSDWLEGNLRSAAVIAGTTAGFGVLLWLADIWSRRHRRIEAFGVRDALLVGMAQVLSLVPGTSRSGITMTAALALGFDRESAARFSFLLAVPVIMLAASYQTLKLVLAPEATNWLQLGVAVGASALAAYLCIGWFMRFVASAGMLVFALYRVLLAIVIVLTFYVL